MRPYRLTYGRMENGGSAVAGYVCGGHAVRPGERHRLETGTRKEIAIGERTLERLGPCQQTVGVAGHGAGR